MSVDKVFEGIHRQERDELEKRAISYNERMRRKFQAFYKPVLEAKALTGEQRLKLVDNWVSLRKSMDASLGNMYFDHVRAKGDYANFIIKGLVIAEPARCEECDDELKIDVQISQGISSQCAPKGLIDAIKYTGSDAYMLKPDFDDEGYVLLDKSLIRAINQDLRNYESRILRASKFIALIKPIVGESDG